MAHRHEHAEHLRSGWDKQERSSGVSVARLGMRRGASSGMMGETSSAGCGRCKQLYGWRGRRRPVGTEAVDDRASDDDACANQPSEKWTSANVLRSRGWHGSPSVMPRCAQRWWWSTKDLTSASSASATLSQWTTSHSSRCTIRSSGRPAVGAPCASDVLPLTRHQHVRQRQEPTWAAMHQGVVDLTRRTEVSQAGDGSRPAGTVRWRKRAILDLIL